VISRTLHARASCHASSVHALRPFLVVLLIALPLAAQDDTLDEADLPGVYRLVPSTERAQETIDTAIRAGVDSMGPLRRAVGSRRLRAKNRILRELEITFSGERVAVRYDADRYEVRRNVREPITLPDGERVHLRATVNGPRLVLDWKTDDGERRDTFTRRSDGTLVFGVTVTSEQLPNPVRYRLAYRAR
jgi:hypothetical protein